MAFYDNLLAEQPWSFRPAFPDTWISDLFAMENETLAKALQTSISGGAAAASSHGSATSSGMLQSVYSKVDSTPVQTPTVSGVSESDALAPKQRRSARVPPRGGRVATKRKARPSKRAAGTTFFAVDPENFMQMVQEVTGVRLGGASELLASAAVMKPEPRRSAAGGFPTLDTSAFMLGSSVSSLVSPPYAAATDGGAGSTERYFDTLCSFPTLESWEAV